MGRFTEKDESICNYCEYERNNGCIKTDPAKCVFNITWDKLKHYEDLEEAGRLIELPCKVGTDTYCILARYNFKRRESEYYIEVFPFEADMAKGMGEKFFLTKAEAKAKLAELKGENNA